MISSWGQRSPWLMLREASRRNTAAIRAGRVTLVKASVDQLPSALDGPFDAIFAVNSLAFWPAPVELRRRLAPGGRVAIEPITFGGRHLLTHGGELARGAE
ncbi:MAG TPA: class I SAM-dependent methyltransferase [Streptosporangiaceae bacterium]